jgi:hypothetical protein
MNPVRLCSIPPDHFHCKTKTRKPNLCHPEAFLWPKDLAVAVAVDLAVAVDSVSRLT